jgi:hypothetical protein
MLVLIGSLSYLPAYFLEMAFGTMDEEVTELMELEEEESEESENEKEEKKAKDQVFCVVRSHQLLSELTKNASFEWIKNWSKPYIPITSPPPDFQFS